MRYLITGGAGFIGSHLAQRLIERGDSVIALDNLSTGNHENIQLLEQSDRFHLAYGSITDHSLVTECIKKVDRVFHLASTVGVKLVIEKPIETIETISGGSAIVFSVCARYRVPVLLASTSEVYGKSTILPFSEDSDSVIGPPIYRRWAYASAKGLDEFLALAYWAQIRLPVVLARLFNTVGPRQSGQYGMVVPRMIRQALNGENLTVFGDGNQSRCFCHVQDAVTALIDLLDHPSCAGELFNVGSNEHITINELAKKIIELTGSDSQIEKISYKEAYGKEFEDIRHRIPSLDKIKRYINFNSTYNLDAIIKDVIEYEKAHIKSIL